MFGKLFVILEVDCRGEQDGINKVIIKDMKKIAIFTSGTGDATSRLVSAFNEGDQIRVELVVTDRGDTRLVEQMIQKGVNAMFLPRELWRINPGNILNLLDENQIDFIALDELDGFLPEEVSDRFEGRIATLTNPSDAPREIMEALGLEEKENVQSETAAPAPEGSPKSVDEAWAETLKVKFDPGQAAQTPPPIPVTERPTPNADNRQYQSPYQTQNQTQTQQQPLNQQPRQQYGYAQQNQEPMPSTYLVWSIVCTILCCFIPGIVAIIFSSQVSTKYYAGDIEGAKRASRNAEIWIIVSFVLGVLTATLYWPIMLFSA